MRKVNFHTLDKLTVPDALIKKALALPESDKSDVRRSLRKPLIAAAVVLLILGVALIYGIYLTPSAAMYLDSRESVTLTLNSRGNVLSDSGHPDLRGQSAKKAVAAITLEMLDSGAIDEDENTLILGAEKLSQQAQATLLDTVLKTFLERRFRGAIVCLPCTGSGAKAAVIDLLVNADIGFTADSLRALSANDLNLLLHEYKVNGAQMVGKPSESGYIGKDAAIRRAEQNSKQTNAQISATYTVYHRRLVYLIRVLDKNRAEAYFINTSDGTIETALQATPELLAQEIQTSVNDSNTPKADTDEAQNNAMTRPQVQPTSFRNTSSAVTEQTDPTVTDNHIPTSAVPTDAANTDKPTDTPKSVPAAGKPETQQPSESTGMDFSPDKVLVVMTQDVSMKFTNFTADDFPELKLAEVSDLSSSITHKYEEYVAEYLKQANPSLSETEKLAYAEQRAKSLIKSDYPKYQKILLLTLTSEDKNEVLRAVDLLNRRSDVYFAEPDYTNNGSQD